MILDSPPHIATIYVEETYTDTYGNEQRRPSTNGVLVKCMVSPIRSTREVSQLGRIEETYKLIARTAPLAHWSRVEWNDMTLTVDEIKRYELGSPTDHVEAVLRRER